MLNKLRKSRLGFTLMEVLIVVAILAILAGIGIAVVPRLRDILTQREMDAKAATLYTAVQNRLSELRSSGSESVYREYDAEGNVVPASGLTRADYTPTGYDPGPSDPLNPNGFTDVMCWFSKTSPINSVIVPAERIDASLTGNWLVEFNFKSGTVYGVFYSEDIDFGNQKPDNYDQYRNDAARKNYYKTNPGHHLGYCGATDTAMTPDSVSIIPSVDIHNGEELIAEFRVKYDDKVTAKIKKVRPSIIYEYTLEEVGPDGNSTGASHTGSIEIDYSADNPDYSFELVIDSLSDDPPKEDSPTSLRHNLMYPAASQRYKDAVESENFSNGTADFTPGYNLKISEVKAVSVLNPRPEDQTDKDYAPVVFNSLFGNTDLYVNLDNIKDSDDGDGLIYDGLFSSDNEGEGEAEPQEGIGTAFDESGAGTAAVLKGRHLQNLDSDSGVTDKFHDAFIADNIYFGEGSEWLSVYVGTGATQKSSGIINTRTASDDEFLFESINNKNLTGIFDGNGSFADEGSDMAAKLAAKGVSELSFTVFDIGFEDEESTGLFANCYLSKIQDLNMLRPGVDSGSSGVSELSVLVGKNVKPLSLENISVRNSASEDKDEPEALISFNSAEYVGVLVARQQEKLTIDNCTLESPKIVSESNGSRANAACGVGCSESGLNINGLTVEAPVINGRGYSAVGVVVGQCADGSDMVIGSTAGTGLTEEKPYSCYIEAPKLYLSSLRGSAAAGGVAGSVSTGAKLSLNDVKIDYNGEGAQLDMSGARANAYAGGVVGRISGDAKTENASFNRVIVTNPAVYSAAPLSGSAECCAGAFIGKLDGTCSLTDCKTYLDTNIGVNADRIANVKGYYTGGFAGLCGENANLSLKNSFAALNLGDIKVTGYNGGFIGLNRGVVDAVSCYADSYLESVSVAGGFIGSVQNSPELSFEKCYAAGSIAYAGAVQSGFFYDEADADATFTDCYTIVYPSDIGKFIVTVNGEPDMTRTYYAFGETKEEKTTPAPTVGTRAESVEVEGTVSTQTGWQKLMCALFRATNGEDFVERINNNPDEPSNIVKPFIAATYYNISFTYMNSYGEWVKETFSVKKGSSVLNLVSPPSPTIDGTKYTHSYWSPVLTLAYSDKDYTATYLRSHDDYTITFKNENGSVIKSSKWVKGATPTCTAPSKAGYHFDGWIRQSTGALIPAGESIPKVTSAETYTAKFTKYYTVKYTNTYNSSQNQTYNNCLEGSATPQYQGTPTRAAGSGYTYRFSGWSPALSNKVTQDITYEAQFVKQYTITYEYIKDNGGGIGEWTFTTEPVDEGTSADVIKSKAPSAPTSPLIIDNVYYNFTGWPTFTSANASTTYKANYEKGYTVTYKNEFDSNQNKVFKNCKEGSATPAYGTDPTRAGGTGYTYRFDGWTPDPKSYPTVTGNLTFKAKFVKQYTITYEYIQDNGSGTGAWTYTTEPVDEGTSADVIKSKAPSAPTSPLIIDNVYYNFTGWPTFTSANASTTYKANYEKGYTVTYKNEFDSNQNKVFKNCKEGSATPAYGTDPTRAGGTGYTYRFNGWNPSVAQTVTGNVTYNAQFVKQYTITYEYIKDNGGGTGAWTYTTETVDEGTSADTIKSKAPSAPTSPLIIDNVYYNFTGWPTFTSANASTTYKANYEKGYTVTYKNEFDSNQNKVFKNCKEGSATPAYGTDPTRAGGTGYTYRFNGWNPSVAQTVTGNVTYNAQFVKQFKITYEYIKDNGGGIGEWTSTTETVDEGTSADVIKSKAPNAPTSPLTIGDTIYNFKSWPAFAAAAASTTYTAQYGKGYTIVYQNEYNESETKKYENCAEGSTMPQYPGTPTRAAEGECTYRFTGWSPDPKDYPTVTGNVTFKAQFVKQYVITFVDGNGKTLQSSKWDYGQTPSYTGSETPTKTGDAQYTYTFNNKWSPEITTVTGPATYTAQFSSTVNKYKITFVDGDGETLQALDWEYGSRPSYSLSTPTKKATAQYTYTFNNKWSPEITNVTGPATYTAQFDSTVNKYTITFVDGDNIPIQSSEVEYGKTPAYTGSTTPTKTATAQYSYTFNNKWSPEIVPVKEAATYTAQFDSTVRKYTVTFYDDNGTTVLKSADYEYGQTPSCPDPTKPATAEHTYKFDHWDPAITTVTGTASYTAVYTSTTNMYTVTFVDGNGKTLQSSKWDYGQTPSYTGSETPSKTGDDQYSYTFNNTWSPAIEAVTGDATYTAQFDRTVNKYSVSFVNWDGSPLTASQNLDYGTTPQYKGDTPTRAADAQGTYTFSHWEPAIGPVTGNVTYVAQYSVELNQYTITFLNDDLSTLQSGKVNYGVMPSYSGGTPVSSHDDDDVYYAFTGWNPTLTPVTGDATYTAQYTAQPIPSTPPIPTPSPDPSIFDDINGEKIPEEWYYGQTNSAKPIYGFTIAPGGVTTFAYYDQGCVNNNYPLPEIDGITKTTVDAIQYRHFGDWKLPAIAEIEYSDVYNEEELYFMAIAKNVSSSKVPGIIEADFSSFDYYLTDAETSAKSSVRTGAFYEVTAGTVKDKSGKDVAAGTITTNWGDKITKAEWADYVGEYGTIVILDSLRADDGVQDRRFVYQFANDVTVGDGQKLTPGDNMTIDVSFSTGGWNTLRSSTTITSQKFNSLFGNETLYLDPAKDTDNHDGYISSQKPASGEFTELKGTDLKTKTAAILWGRHLQNLEPDSGVGTKIKSAFLADNLYMGDDSEWAKAKGDKYFRPLNNSSFVGVLDGNGSYGQTSGFNYTIYDFSPADAANSCMFHIEYGSEIRDLNMVRPTVDSKSGSNRLSVFAGNSGASKTLTFTNVNVIDASIKSNGSSSVSHMAIFDADPWNDVVVNNCTVENAVFESTRAEGKANAGIVTAVCYYGLTANDLTITSPTFSGQGIAFAGAVLGRTANGSATVRITDSAVSSPSINLTGKTVSDYAGGIIGNASGANDKVTLTNVAVTDPAVYVPGAADSHEYCAGGFVGSMNGAVTLTNCRTYLTDTSEKTVNVNGRYSGGFVGFSTGSLTLNTSFAALSIGSSDNTAANSAQYIGGFVGLNASNVTATDCYTDCYLECWDTAGGFMGRSVNMPNLTFTRCYSAGFITKAPGKQSGFFYDRGEQISESDPKHRLAKSVFTDCYSVIYPYKTDNFYPTVGMIDISKASGYVTMTNTYYGFASTASANNLGKRIPYEWYEGTFGSTANPLGGYTKLADGKTFAYRVNTGKDYPFPELTAIPATEDGYIHYGDWKLPAAVRINGHIVGMETLLVAATGESADLKNVPGAISLDMSKVSFTVKTADIGYLTSVSNIDSYPTKTRSTASRLIGDDGIMYNEWDEASSGWGDEYWHYNGKYGAIITLDSLKDGRRFKELFTAADGFTPGHNLYIEIGLAYSSGGSAWDTITEKTYYDNPNKTHSNREANSLYASLTGDGGTAKICWGRHLQNLDSDSGIEGRVTIAKLDRRIEFGVDTNWREDYGDRKFIPINNTYITEFDGSRGIGCFISDLPIETSMQSGLFGKVVSGQTFTIKDTLMYSPAITVKGGSYGGSLMGGIEKTANVTISNCAISDPVICGDGTGYANRSGGLVGTSSGTLTISDCSVYGSSASVSSKKYSGGLLGYNAGTLTMNASFAAATVDSTVGTETYSGGMIGYSGGKTTVTDCYSDCYLGGDYAGGFIGASVASVKNSFVRCYSAGTVRYAKTAQAGFYYDTGTATGTFTDCYTVLYPYTGTDNAMLAKFYATVNKYGSGSMTRTYYGFASTVSANNLGTRLPYEWYEATPETDLSKGSFPINGFRALDKKNTTLETKAYKAELSGKNYPMPEIKAIKKVSERGSEYNGKVHFGDWALPRAIGVADSTNTGLINREELLYVAVRGDAVQTAQVPGVVDTSNLSNVSFKYRLKDKWTNADTGWLTETGVTISNGKIKNQWDEDYTNTTDWAQYNGVPGRIITFDSLKKDGARRFKALYGDKYGLTPGDMMTISLTLDGGEDYIWYTVYEVKIEDFNSLFGECSTAGRESDKWSAHIYYGRHLQNLDKDSGITTGAKSSFEKEYMCADVRSDIFFNKDEDKNDSEWLKTYGSLKFKPIENVIIRFSSSDVSSYPHQTEKRTTGKLYGRSHEINDIPIETSGYAGLFSDIKNSLELNNVILKNPVVKSTGSSAGAFAGNASSGLLIIRTCGVYGENSSVTGAANAGGLLGETNTESEIYCSYAATANTTAGSYGGGLIGTAKSQAKILKSYSDSYVCGTKAGGLVGKFSSSEYLYLSSCYSAGFLTGSSVEGGLVAEGTNIRIATPSEDGSEYLDDTTVYTVCKPTNEVSYYSTAPAFDVGRGRVYYLYKSYDQQNYGNRISLTWADNYGVSNLSKRQAFAAELNNYGTSDFDGNDRSLDTSDPTSTYPYAASLKGKQYPFPTLTGYDSAKIRHAGDWDTSYSFSDDPLGLDEYASSYGYYELYQDGTYGYYPIFGFELNNDGSVKQVYYRAQYDSTNGYQKVTDAATMKFFAKYTSLDDSKIIVGDGYGFTIPEDDNYWYYWSDKRTNTLVTLEGPDGYIHGADSDIEKLIDVNDNKAHGYLYALDPDYVDEDYSKNNIITIKTMGNPYSLVNIYRSESSISSFSGKGRYQLASDTHFAKDGFYCGYSEENMVDNRPANLLGLIRLMVTDPILRTARHLYNLSCYYELYSNSSWIAQLITFKQQYDIDYDTYHWTDFTEHGQPEYQTPIGDNYGDFAVNYEGNSYEIKNISFAYKQFKDCTLSGLFGNLYPKLIGEGHSGRVSGVHLVGNGSEIQVAPSQKINNERRDGHTGAIAAKLEYLTTPGVEWSSQPRLGECSVQGYTFTRGEYVYETAEYDSDLVYVGGICGFDKVYDTKGDDSGKRVVNCRTYSDPTKQITLYAGGHVSKICGNYGTTKSFVTFMASMSDPSFETQEQQILYVTALDDENKVITDELNIDVCADGSSVALNSLSEDYVDETTGLTVGQMTDSEEGQFADAKAYLLTGVEPGVTEITVSLVHSPDQVTELEEAAAVEEAPEAELIPEGETVPEGEEIPAAEETPTAEEIPVVEEIHAAEEAPVIETGLAVEEAPAEEEKKPSLFSSLMALFSGNSDDTESVSGEHEEADIQSILDFAAMSDDSDEEVTVEYVAEPLTIVATVQNKAAEDTEDDEDETEEPAEEPEEDEDEPVSENAHAGLAVISEDGSSFESDWDYRLADGSIGEFSMEKSDSLRMGSGNVLLFSEGVKLSGDNAHYALTKINVLRTEMTVVDGVAVPSGVVTPYTVYDAELSEEPDYTDYFVKFGNEQYAVVGESRLRLIPITVTGAHTDPINVTLTFSDGVSSFDLSCRLDSVNNVFTVVHKDGDEVIKEQLVPYGKDFVQPEELEHRVGYVYEEPLWDTEVSPVYEDLTVHTNSRPISYTIVFDGGSGEGSMDEMVLNYGDALNLSRCSFIYPEHSFVGWALSSDGDVAYSDGSVVYALSSRDGAVITLYAVWADTVDTANNGEETVFIPDDVIFVTSDDGEQSAHSDSTNADDNVHYTGLEGFIAS